MEKVVVFGGSGFIGGHLADGLSAKGYAVTIFDQFPSSWLQEGQTMVVGDILNCDQVKEAVVGAKIVYHFAGEADIGKPRTLPHDIMNTNVIGTCNVLSACTQASVERFVFASSYYACGNSGGFYCVSKVSCEKMIEEFGRQFDISYTILRLGSIYGPRANGFNSIRNMLKEALATGTITCGGDPERVREFIHVKDVVAESIRILSAKYKNSCLILKGSQPLSLNQLLEMIKEIAGDNIDVKFLPPGDHLHYHLTPYADTSIKALCLATHDHIELGQGIIEVFYELRQEN